MQSSNIRREQIRKLNAPGGGAPHASKVNMDNTKLVNSKGRGALPVPNLAAVVLLSVMVKVR